MIDQEKATLAAVTLANKTLVRDLAAVLNKYSVENDSDTPDYILAEMLVSVLTAYSSAVSSRDGLLPSVSLGRANPSEQAHE